MVLEVRKVRRMLSHCKAIRNAANITANFEKSRSKIRHFRLQKSEKVLRNPGGTELCIPHYLQFVTIQNCTNCTIFEGNFHYWSM